MDYLQDLDRELALTKEIAQAADDITSQTRNGVTRKFAANHIAEAATNVLNEQLQCGGGLSREWTKTVINLAIVKALEIDDPKT